MLDPKMPARVNVKVLVILAIVVVTLGGSLVAARQIRRSVLSKRALAAGEAAFADKNWARAARDLGEYLGRNPDDIAILKKYAQARLSVRPLESINIGRAINAYRRIIQLDPHDEVAYEKLAELYGGTGNSAELAYVARVRLEHAPHDRKAPLWLASALVRLNRQAEAQQVLEQLTQELQTQDDKHAEYVDACAQMSAIIATGASAADKANGLAWLTKAVNYAPDSVEARIYRAHFYLQTLDIPDLSNDDRLTLARQDLEQADGVGTQDPRLLLSLAAAWLAHGDGLDQAAAELRLAENVTPAAREASFPDVNDWNAARFLLASELAIRQGTAAQNVSLADQTLTVLRERRHRVKVLSSAIRLYLAAGRAPEARRCLTEYQDEFLTQVKTSETRAEAAYLQAQVARAEGRPYTVIGALQSFLVIDSAQPELWKLLAEAYIRTDQTRRAVDALVQYLRLAPRDPAMTLQLAREYAGLGEWENAFKAARQAELLDPAAAAPKLRRIEASLFQAAQRRTNLSPAELEKFSAEVADLRRTDPNRVETRLLQATIAEYVGRPEEAERELKLAIEECPESLPAEMQLARHYHRTQRTAEALQVCENSCRRHAEVAEPWLALSSLQAAAANYEAARACLKQGLGHIVGPEEKRILSLSLASLELQRGDRKAGIGLLKDLAAQDEGEVRARSRLLDVQEIRDDSRTAAQLVQELRQAEGQTGLLWRLHQASLWLSSPDWSAQQKGIVDHLQYCIDSDPQWSAPVLLLAQLYEKQEDPQRVEDLCRRAWARNTAATELANRLLRLLEEQKRFSEAQQVLQRMQADARVTRLWKVRLALRAGDVPRAMEELKLQVANDERDVDARIRLAVLVYQQTHDVVQAFRYLDEAQVAAGGATLALMNARVALLKAEGRSAEAQRALDDYVSSRSDAGAYLLRAVYRAEAGQWEQAEQDYKQLTTFTETGASGYALLSDFYVRWGKPDDAVAALDEGLGTYADNSGLKRKLVRRLLSRPRIQDRARALDLLNILERQFPQDRELMKLRATALLQEATPEALATAKDKLEEVIRQEPTATDAHLTLIGLALRQEQYETAREYAIGAIDSNPDHAGLLLARAEAELALNHGLEAVELTRLVLRQDPNEQILGPLVGVALRSKDAGLLEEVRERVDARLADRPAAPDLLLWRAHLLASLKSPRTAIPELEAYCRTDEGSSHIMSLVVLGELYRLAGDLEQSEQWIRRAERVDPNHQVVIHARSVWRIAQERWDELAHVSAAYISAQPQNPNLVLTAASLLSSLDSAPLKNEGRKLFEHAVRLTPTSLRARLGLATSLYQTGDVDEAEKAYRELLRERPDDIRVLNNLAWILQERDQRYAEALELVNRGLSFAPTETNLLDTRGTILLHMPGRLADARRDFETLLELSAADPRRQARTLLQLGRTCAGLHDAANVRKHLNTALEIDRTNRVFTEAERSEIARILQSN